MTWARVLLPATVGAALATWAWAAISTDLKPEALFLVANDQEISARSLCETVGRVKPDPSCELTDLGVQDFDKHLVSNLKLDRRCNGLKILLMSTVEEASKTKDFIDPNLYLYVDYYPGKTFSDWSIGYDRGYGGLRNLVSDIIGKPHFQDLRPLNRGNVEDIASEACSLADLKLYHSR